MTLRQSRWLPDGLAGRFALLLACALIAANLLALFVLSVERARWGRESRDSREVERIVALIPVLESVEEDAREGIARNASTRVARVDITDQPRVPMTAPDSRSRALRDRLLETLSPRQVFVVVGNAPPPRRGSPDRHVGRDDHGPDDRGHDFISVSINLAGHDRSDPELAEHGWVNIQARSIPPPRGALVEEGVFFLVLGLSLVSVLGVGLLFLRRLTRPLAQLSEAAQAAGRGDRSARVPEEGAREMREAAHAFNAMQAEIASFESERTRTLAAVGHDLRTPITSLRIRAEMLDDEVRDPMVRTLDEMTVMADGLVAFARGDGDAEERQLVDLNEMLQRLCEDRGAVFSAAAQVTVPGRPVALVRAIGNLIDNAMRYASSATVALDCADEQAVITIEDEGPGIPEQRLASVFEPFVRGEESRNPDTGGAGLGLSIARSIIRAHGGSVTLSNRRPKGLRVVVRLPATR